METNPITTSSTSRPARSAEAVPVQWVERLFERLLAVLGSAMSNVYANADPEIVKAEWAEALVGFSTEELQRGLAAVRTRRFAPNLPEFLHLCRPALDPEVAWLEASEGIRSHAAGKRFAWSHSAVFWAARTMSYELRSSTFQAQRKRWEQALALEWAKGAWASPTDPTQRAIEHEQGTFAPEMIDAAVESMRNTRRALTGFSSKAEEEAARFQGGEA
jgi:hypothetical protein